MIRREMPHLAMVWTFVRRHERLEVRREEAADGRPVLVVTGGDAAGSTVFSDMAALVRQQTRLEVMLIDSGWSLVSFEPERRSVADRRATNRETADRRHLWWTDAEVRRRGE
jgi:hypothetical protein